MNLTRRTSTATTTTTPPPPINNNTNKNNNKNHHKNNNNNRQQQTTTSNSLRLQLERRPADSARVYVHLMGSCIAGQVGGALLQGRWGPLCRACGRLVTPKKKQQKKRVSRRSRRHRNVRSGAHLGVHRRAHFAARAESGKKDFAWAFLFFQSFFSSVVFALFF